MGRIDKNDITGSVFVRRHPEQTVELLVADAVLQVFEGQSHAQFYRDDRVPEVKEAFQEIAGFFDRHLGQ